MRESAPGAANEEADRWTGVFDALREGFQIIGRDWRYLYVNEGAATHGRTTREALLGKTMMEVYPGIEQTQMYALAQRCMNDRTPGEMDNQFVYPDGRAAWFELRLRPVPEGLMILSLDITSRKELEAQLLHAQKMEAVGRLAGGIAHDFNNILTAISSFGAMAANSIGRDHDARGDVEEVLIAAGRAARLVRQLMEFSRKRPVEPEVLEVNELVADLESLLCRTLGEDIELAVNLDAGVGAVRIDPSAFEQVLVNLAINSRDAMPDGGMLTIETAVAKLDEHHHMARAEQVAPGDYVVVAVTDSGHGMPPEVRDQVFEPFFTTKEPGRGTGLGLATSYGIVRQAGGYIWLYSEPGRGTTFKIYLPHRQSAAAAIVKVPSQEAELEGNERVLVVEDDPQVLALTARGLSHYGYDVLRAGSCADALALCAADHRQIHLLLSDIVMPTMSGTALAAQLVAARPLLRVLHMSGYTRSAALHNQLIGPEARLLEKPFTPEVLARAVRAALDD